MGFFHWLWPTLLVFIADRQSSPLVRHPRTTLAAIKLVDIRHSTGSSTQRQSILRSDSCWNTYLIGQLKTTIAEKGVQLRREIVGNMQELDHHSQSRLGWALPAHSFQPLQTDIMIATFSFAQSLAVQCFPSIILLLSQFAHLLSLLWRAPKVLKCVKLLNYL